MSFGEALLYDVGPKGCYILIVRFIILLTSASVSVRQIGCPVLACSPFTFLRVAGLAGGGTWHHRMWCHLSYLLTLLTHTAPSFTV